MIGYFVIPTRAKGTRGIQTSGSLPEFALTAVGAEVTVPQNLLYTAISGSKLLLGGTNGFPIAVY